MSISPSYLETRKSSFTITFAIEIVGLNIWHDCNEGWLDLGPPVQGMKIQYQIYPGTTYDIDVLIWPHAAKVFCGNNSCWVRTWQYLQRRWMAFSISHILAVRVTNFQDHVVSINRTIGLGVISTSAKGDKTSEVYLPRLKFGQRRYFAPVLEREASEPVDLYIGGLIWNQVVEQIPKTVYDEVFNTPHSVSDIRHQDAVVYNVQDRILNARPPEELSFSVPEVEPLKSKANAKIDPRNKEKKKPEKEERKFEIKLSGDTIIAGTGRVTLFEESGDRPPDYAEFIALISSNNLPAEDDHPVTFVNIGKVTDIPVKEFIKQNITHIYTRWCLSDEEHVSELKPIQQSRTEVDFNDHHAIILPFESASEIIAVFMDGRYRIEIRGIRPALSNIDKSSFFGYAKGDNYFGKMIASKIPDYDTDVLICETRIDARSLLNTHNGFIRGDYPLYPPGMTVEHSDREEVCTNEINAIRVAVKPHLVVQPGVVLEAQMTLEVSIGVVGCKTRKMPQKYARLLCMVSDSDAILAIIQETVDINDNLMKKELRDQLLTGYCIDTGDTVFLYVEGPRDGKILHVWDMTTEYPEINPTFSSADKYRCRLYPEMLQTPSPFNILKMYAPISLVLSCPSMYARPALPLPAKSALLKIGRLLAGEKSLHTVPSYDKLPSAMELKSFRLELCVAPRPPPIELHLSQRHPETQKRPKKMTLVDINLARSSSQLIGET